MKKKFMERFKHLSETSYNPKKNLELGDIVERAEISFKPEAWTREFEKGEMVQSLPISQHSRDRNHPRQLLVYVIELVREGHEVNLAYTEERKPNSGKYYSFWLANVKDITGYQKIILEKECP